MLERISKVAEATDVTQYVHSAEKGSSCLLMFVALLKAAVACEGEASWLFVLVCYAAVAQTDSKSQTAVDNQINDAATKHCSS